jgi:CRISPR-associated protein Cmx8
MAKQAAPEAVEVRYDLFDLPTAQHKAGLAGLILAIRSLKERSEKDPEEIPPESVPEIPEGPDDTGVKVRFTAQSVQTLLDDMYNAQKVASEPRAKPRTKGKGGAKLIIPPDEKVPMTVVDRKTGEKREVTGYVYLDTIPRLAVLEPLLPPVAEWIKLWREMLWSIPRNKPRSRLPFEQRAKKKHCKEGTTAWANLRKADKDPLKTVPVSESLWLGAQKENAERVPFQGRLAHNLLLHFWPLAVFVTVPWRIGRDGKQKEVGYVVAIPEVSRLRRFCDTLPRALSSLGTKVSRLRPVRPIQAVINVADQGALEFINSIARLKTAEQEDNPTRSVNTVEFLHLDRQGNNVKLLTSGRVAPDLELLDGYRDIVGRPGEAPRYYNPLFKVALIQALLRGKPWWGEMLPLFMSRDWRFFVQASDTAQRAADISRLPGFWSDAERRFQQDIRWLRQRKEVSKAMPPEEAEKHRPTPVQRLPDIIRRLVRTYVFRRAEDRSGKELKCYRQTGGKTNWKIVPREFHEEKQKVAQSLFLEFRSRRDQAFVDHFSATFFSVGQYYDEANEDFETLSAFLLGREGERRDDVKTLTLQALSAVSWTAPEREEKGDEE